MSKELYEKLLEIVKQSQDGKVLFNRPVDLPPCEMLDMLILSILQYEESIDEALTSFRYCILELTNAKKALEQYDIGA